MTTSPINLRLKIDPVEYDRRKSLFRERRERLTDLQQEGRGLILGFAIFDEAAALDASLWDSLEEKLRDDPRVKEFIAYDPGEPCRHETFCRECGHCACRRGPRLHGQDQIRDRALLEMRQSEQEYTMGLSLSTPDTIPGRAPAHAHLQEILDKLYCRSSDAVSIETLRRLLADAVPGLVQYAAEGLGIEPRALLERAAKGELTYADLADAAGAPAPGRKISRRLAG